MNPRTAICITTAVAVLAAPATAERGSDGHVSIIYWQAPSILNPYLATGSKDVQSANIMLEPLARFDATGAMVPVLATAIPTLENGGVSADLTSITWQLRPGVVWSDGTPFEAHDVAFTWAYCTHPEGGCSQLRAFDGVIAVETPDALTVRIVFDAARPYPYVPFVGGESPVIQRAQFEDCAGARAPECTAQNFAPIGTGPFRVIDFRTNDMIRFDANPHYRDPARPRFSTMTLKGGGTAEAAARAVLETGEFDYALNLQIPPDVLAQMAATGKGVAMSAFGTLVERLEINLTDPSPSLPEGSRATAAHPHPVLTDIRVREALSLAIDRTALAEIGYGTSGRPTCNIVPAPAAYASDNSSCLVQDPERARALLDAAGWAVGRDGVRTRDGERLSLLFQTSTNSVRQDFQALIKQWWAEIGVETELKDTPPAVFFGSDPGSTDTFQRFYADVQMYARNFAGIDPQSYLAAYACGKAPRPETQWQGENLNRYCDPDYDLLLAELAGTGELARRQAIARKLNDMLTAESHVVLPLVWRGAVSARAQSLGGVVLNPWDVELWNIGDWFRVE